MNIGIFGGSFNPIHRGHKNALESFIASARLDKVFVIPSFFPPHKEMPSLWADFEDRMNMVKLALGNIPNVIFSEVEKELFEESGEKSYTKITLDRLKKTYPGDYYLYVGTDMFLTLHKWHDPQWIFDNAVIAVMDRYKESSDIRAQKKYLEDTFGARVMIIDGEVKEISSTEIRGNLAAMSDMLDAKVSEYIVENFLYTERMSLDNLREYVKKTLPEKRLTHTLAVEKETRYIASHLCPDFSEELSRGALLHDITKYLSKDEHSEIVKDLSYDDINSPETLHAKSGALKAKAMGESMWRTIESHTTGKPCMSLFEMIIFVSDYTEETRSHESCRKERTVLHDALEEASCFVEKRQALEDSVRRILETTISYLTEKNTFIHPRTLDALEYYRHQK